MAEPERYVALAKTDIVLLLVVFNASRTAIMTKNIVLSIGLIVLFGVVGILLIALLFLLHLTVSAGTINGMIFYHLMI